MLYLVKIFDEIDDFVGPLFVMAGIADVLCGAMLIGSITAALAVQSVKIALAGAIVSGLIVAGREWLPTSAGAQPARLQPLRQLR